MSTGINSSLEATAKKIILKQANETGKVMPALLGAQAAFSKTLCVGTPNVPDEEAFIRRMRDILKSQRLTNLGPYVTEFEKRVAEIAGTRHCVATCNATLGLELTIKALGMHGDVIVPSYTFVATVHALARQGITPIFCDVDPDTHCLDPASVERAITSKTTGIIGVHLWGNTDSTAALRDIAEHHQLKLVFDAAHAFGCGSKQRAVGSYGDAEVFSFHATKFLNSFEGGAIVTDNGKLADRLRLMTNFGFAGEDNVEYLATNAKMTEACGAMGLTSLESMQSIISHNLKNYQAYESALESIGGLKLMTRAIDQPNNYQYIVVDIDATEINLSRDELVAALRFENVLARRYFYPGVHRMRPYAEMYPRVGDCLPVTEQLADRIMVLPTGTAVSPVDVKVLVERIALIISHAVDVKNALYTSVDQRIPDFIRRA